MVPYGGPIRFQEVTKRLVVGLAGDDAAVRLDAHVIKGGCAAFDAQFKKHRIKMAVLGGGVPDEALPGTVGVRAGDFQKRRQVALSETGADGSPSTGINKRIKAYGGNANLFKERQHPGQVGGVLL